MKIIVGLGNPGSRYETTRHNIGFMAVDLIGEKLNIDFSRQSHSSVIAEGRVGGEKVLLMKPQTFMNLSGQAVVSALNFYKLKPSDLLVIYDDLDLEVGRIRAKAEGSAGGHKGMTSIIQLTGSSEIARIRIGIGKPARGAVVDYVLQPFFDEEWEAVRNGIIKAAEAGIMWLEKGINPVMNSFNTNK